MKKFLFLSFLLCTVFATQAQFKFGLRGGISSLDFDPMPIITGDESLKVAFNDASYGVHGGVFARIGNKIYIQPEILFNSNTVDYDVTDFSGTELLKERYQFVDIPLLVGFKMGFFRVQAGPVGHIFVNSTSELGDKVQNYQQTFEDMTYGYQAGIGLDLGKLIVDVKYEGNFDRFGEHFTIDGTQYMFDGAPARLVASVGLAF
ncbi:MAG: porin family protein [Saprospiraceae bacterium]